MALNVRLTRRAYDELDEIVGYISRDAPVRGQQWRDAVLKRAGSLKDFPLRHGLAPEAHAVGCDIRQAIHGAYRILYMVNDSEVIVLGIRHGARQSLQSDEFPIEE